MELGCKRRFEYVKVVPLYRYSSGLRVRALFLDDHVMMRPTIVTLPSLPPFTYLLSCPSSLVGIKRLFQIPSSLFSQIILTDISVPSLHLFSCKTEPPHKPCVNRLFTGFDPRPSIKNIDQHEATSHCSLSYITVKFERKPPSIKPTTTSPSPSPWESFWKQEMQ